MGPEGQAWVVGTDPAAGAGYSGAVALARLASTQRWISLSGRTLVGRADYATVRLGDPVISNEHAVLAFDGHWWLRDLGSP